MAQFANIMAQAMTQLEQEIQQQIKAVIDSGEVAKRQMAQAAEKTKEEARQKLAEIDNVIAAKFQSIETRMGKLEASINQRFDDYTIKHIAKKDEEINLLRQQISLLEQRLSKREEKDRAIVKILGG